MALPAGTTVKNGFALTPDGALYVTINGSSAYNPAAVAITGGTSLWNDGASGTPSIAFAAQTNTGIWRSLGSRMVFESNGTDSLAIGGNQAILPASGVLYWGVDGTIGTNGVDTALNRVSASIVGMYGGTTATGASLRRYGGNAGYVEWGSVAENLTLSTGGTTTDTAANLLPADSYIEAVTARITTTITTATNWSVGDATTAGRFAAANSTLTAGTTSVGLVHCDVTGAGGPRQTAAAKVRITTTGTPGAGAIRLTSYYRTFVAPTS